jgi:hypothetical protein
VRRFLALIALFGILTGLAVLADSSVAQNPAGWGTVKGRIVWGSGELPKRAELKVDKDKEHCLSKGPILDDEWIVDPKTKGVRYVFVWLAPDNPKAQGTPPIHPSLKEIKEKEVVVDQPCCLFEPRAVALREGQVLVAKNSAPIPHNFKYDAANPTKNPSGNPLIPAGAKVDLTGFREGLVLMSCSFHSWMKGHIRIFDHPYFAVTKEDGSFEFKNAPAGTFRLMVWHGGAGWSGGAAGRYGQPITIKGGDAVTDLGRIEFKTK